MYGTRCAWTNTKGIWKACSWANSKKIIGRFFLETADFRLYKKEFFIKFENGLTERTGFVILKGIKNESWGAKKWRKINRIV